MEQGVFITAKEVAELLGISKSKAYTIVREMNEELSAKGFITVTGRVSRKERIVWRHTKMRNVAHGMSRFIITIGQVRTNAS